MDTTTKATGSIRLSIDGMSCGHCVNAVTKALSAVPGVTVRSVAIGTAEIEAKEGGAAGQAVAALEAAGYPTRTMAGEAPAPARSGGGCCGGGAATKPDMGKTGGCCG